MAVISLPSRSDFDVIFKSPDAKSSSRDFLILAKLNTKIKDHRIGFITPKKRFVALLIAIDSVELCDTFGIMNLTSLPTSLLSLVKRRTTFGH